MYDLIVVLLKKLSCTVPVVATMAAGIVYSPRNSKVIMYAISFTVGHKGIVYSFILVFAIKASL